MEEQPKTILLVEDDETNRKLVRVVLSGKRYLIQEANSVEQALEMLKGVKPDLLLLDIRLGEGSGLDVIRAIRADPTFDEVPAVAITAQAMKDDESRFLAAGFDGYLSKPLDTRKLPEVVERFLREGRRTGHA
ncbi:response regulator [Sulfuricella sp.]|uniref:response regulator n=1 Tax=Sulfuricella sp. TaxID=2099377 RepID=UPI002B94E7B4|nr:response regulator [Sulfuricella sp.]HUX64134.1 response regulator [Sulfuricella sp.]